MAAAKHEDERADIDTLNEIAARVTSDEIDEDVKAALKAATDRIIVRELKKELQKSLLEAISDVKEDVSILLVSDKRVQDAMRKKPGSWFHAEREADRLTDEIIDPITAVFAFLAQHMMDTKDG